jgi:ribosomal protein L29
MKKKNTYNEKTTEDLNKELKTLKATLAEHKRKAIQGKDITSYRSARKNVARVLTALNK